MNYQKEKLRKQSHLPCIKKNKIPRINLLPTGDKRPVLGKL